MNKIFMGVHEITGHYTSLETGLRQINVDCDFISIERSNRFYNISNLHDRLAVIRFWRHFNNLNNTTHRKYFIRKLYSGVMSRFFNYLMLIRNLVKYDVFIFSYGITITNCRLELIVYKLLGKRLIFIFHGSDSRPPYMAGRYANESMAINYDELYELTSKQKQKIRLIERYATVCINWGPAAHFHEKKIVNFFALGFPLKIKPKFPNTHRRTTPPKILHSPSDSMVKGTSVILKALEELKAEGIEFELKLVSNMPNHVIIKELKQCDFLVDCRFSDTPHGVLGAEAALLGVPTVVGGYLHNQIHEYFNNTSTIPPAHYVHPDNLKQGIKKLIVDHDYRKELSNSAYQYAINEYKLNYVASKYKKVIQGDIPAEWYYDPHAIGYINGSISESRLKEIVKILVSRYGLDSLRLSDKPHLERLFMELIKND